MAPPLGPSDPLTGVAAGSPADATDELFALDPGDFVAARNELVKVLRKAGDRDQAARVAGLRRPSPAAWAVNQVARRRPEELWQLVQLGQALRDAQARTLEGADSRLLRQAGRARRDAVGGLVDLAVAFLAERGAGAETHTAEIAATLEAASLDAGAGEAVIAGRLLTGLEPPSGFGEDDAPAPAPAEHARAHPSDPEAEADRKERLERARRAVSDATGLAAAKSAEAAAAASAVGEHESTLGDAEEEVARLERDLEAARRRVDTAAGDLADARTVRSRADAALADAEQRVRDAEDRVGALDQ